MHSQCIDFSLESIHVLILFRENQPCTVKELYAGSHDHAQFMH